MRSYESPAPRIACAFGALAMTALTIGTLVVLPSKMESDSELLAALASSRDAVTACLATLPEAHVSNSN